MKTLKRILVTALIAITVIACTDKKEDYPEQLPKATQTGENTAGCYVNGKLWIMRGKSGGITYPSDETASIGEPTKEYLFYRLGITINDSFFYELSEGKYTNELLDFYVSSSSKIEVKSYLLSKVTGKTSNEGGVSMYANNATTNSKNTGTLTITKLVTTGKKPFIAGTFEFTAVNSKNEVFKITNGRFDLELNKILQ